jgi:hypothetical protein
MTRITGILLALLLPILASAQGGDLQLRAKADALFDEQRFAEAMPLFSQLVSLHPADRQLNYRFGACLLFGSADKEPAIGHLKYATEDPAITPLAWYWLGRAYHLNYRFKEAQAAYLRFLGTGDKKALAAWPVEALQRQCRNGEKLLSNLKEISVRSKTEVAESEFFRFYDLSDFGGRIVVLPEELKTGFDKKRKDRQLVYLPAGGGPIYFSSYGKDGAAGKDIYRTELLPDGTFATPVKLAGYINTDQDEDFPFMHPDGKTFYFSSKGHNSMGGYDVFRAVYDRGLDAFSRPENLDFAISTPDDDILYVTDAEQKEACFASRRDSRQDQVHVYRVATAQQPVQLTVFKGTFASLLDADDRRARIVVEDALTREPVADVRTDINGTYLLSMPRAGRYRYLVECGPSGRTHGGLVDVPKADGPRAYRQELVLEMKGDQEQLSIRNYFDEPLGEDLVALALDEIRRRAKLDVNEQRAVAQQPAETPQEPVRDVMTRAGFTGDVDQAAALRLAKDDAAELDSRAMDLDAQSKEAYALAMDAAAEADRATARAVDLVKQADAAGEEARRNELMTEAARERQRAREAAMRARAAQRTGTALAASALGKRQQALEAAKLSADLGAALGAKREEQALPMLQALKARLDRKARPEMDEDPLEAARKALAEQQQEVDRAMAAARAKRDEENELTDRIGRLKRELEATRAKSKKDELAREIAEGETQLGYLRKETKAAVDAAAAKERQTVVLRGQASLVRHLTTTNDHGAGIELTAAQAEQLGLRLSATEGRMASIAIDERFDTGITGDPVAVEARTFAWDLASAAGAAGASAAPTRSIERSTAADAQRSASRTTAVGQAPLGERSLSSAQVDRAQPVPSDGATEPAGQRAESGAANPNEAASSEAARTASASAGGQPATGAASHSRGAATVSSNAGAQPGAAPIEAAAGSAGQRAAADPVVAPRTAETSAERAVPRDEPDQERFVLENQRAELVQLMQAERNRSRRDSLQARINEADARLAAMERKADEPSGEEAGPPVDLSRPVLRFDAATPDEAIVGQLFADFQRDKERMMRLSDADERASGLHGLESMLADSLLAEMQRQIAVLEMSPQQSETVLPRVNRLRRLREAHLAEGERVLAERQAEIAAVLPDAPADDAAAKRADERYVAIDRYAVNVYESKLEHRSSAAGVTDAVAFKEADLVRIAGLTARIDSLEQVLAGMGRNKESERLRRRTDQLIDERLIIRTDLGQRSAFLIKAEWKAATDSLSALAKAGAAKGLAPDEPLLLMAQGMRSDAKRGMDQAALLRKRADRSDDIVLRDSLYRRAYLMELEALRESDRAMTVHAHLNGAAHVRGERLTYEEVAAKVHGTKAPAAGSDALAARRATDSAAPAAREANPANAGATDPRLAAAPSAAAPIRSAPSMAANQPGTRTAGPEEQSAAAPDHTVAAARTEQAQPASTAVLGGAQAAQAQINQAEQRLAPTDRRAAHLYERYLQGENTLLGAAGSAQEDPDLLDLKATRLSGEAAELEAGSRRAAEAALQLSDSAGHARKRRDQEHLGLMAVRQRSLSDSLHAAALRSREMAEALVRDRDAALAQKAFQARLARFYYLTPEDQVLVLQEEDRSRYYQARTKALEQSAAADSASGASRSNRAVAEVLSQQARAVEREAAQGRMPAADAVQRAQLLDARASLLRLRADSLDNVADRLRGAAGINEAQAAAMLQGMDADRSTVLMEQEQRTRRADAVLAAARGQAGTQRGQASQPVDRRAAEASAVVTQQTPPAAAANQRPASGAEARLEQAASTAGTVSNRPFEEAPAAQRRDAGGSEAVLPRSASEPAGRVGSARPAAAAQPASGTAASPTWRMPDELVEDQFELRSGGERRSEAIPMDAGMPGGIVFKVQIGAFRKAVPTETFSDMTPVMGETVGNGLVRYTAGLFTGFGQAANAKDLVRERGYSDAFVVAYRDGKRIPLGEAMREQQPALAARRTEPARTPEPEQRIIEAAQAVPQPGVAAAITSPAGQAVAADPDAATVAARYGGSADAILQAFVPSTEALAYYNIPGAAPAMQVEAVKGLFFTVQVGVYSKPVPLDKLFNITPLNSELTETAKVRYTTGRYRNLDAARARKDEAVGLGVKDAFITAYLNGKRIPVRDGALLLERFGPSILAMP